MWKLFKCTTVQTKKVASMERSDKVDPYDKPTYETCEKITVDSNTFIDHCALCFGSYFI